nr:fructose-bisphosphatase class II [Paenibacillus mangrovi]
MDDMVGWDSVLFVATGVTSDGLLKGVRYLPNQKAETHSVITHSQNQIISFLHTIHKMPISSEIFTEAAM